MCEFNSEVPVDTVSVWGEREKERKKKKMKKKEEKPGAAVERDCKNNGIYHMNLQLPMYCPPFLFISFHFPYFSLSCARLAGWLTGWLSVCLEIKQEQTHTHTQCKCDRTTWPRPSQVRPGQARPGRPGRWKKVKEKIEEKCCCRFHSSTAAGAICFAYLSLPVCFPPCTHLQLQFFLLRSINWNWKM